MIADQVHFGAKQLQHVDFVLAARAAGWTVCECEPKPRNVHARRPEVDAPTTPAFVDVLDRGAPGRSMPGQRRAARERL
jgi:hypothetical protein